MRAWVRYLVERLPEVLFGRLSGWTVQQSRRVPVCRDGVDAVSRYSAIRIVTCARHTGEHLEQTDCVAVNVKGRIV